MTTLNDNDIREQLDLLTAEAQAVYSREELQARLRQADRAGRQMRVKLGLDPTAPDIHLGHTVQLRQIRKFQDLGHRAVLIIGDYTARIGDPSGANKTRPVLSPEQIDANAETYLDQAGLILDTSPEKLEVRRNSEWLDKLSLADLLKLAAQMTVARMMERDTFELRYKAGVPIGVHEFFYPLMQGYDSVCIQADVEIGGTDQTFNNLVGRDLQEHAGQPRQIVMTFPLLVGLDGTEKMSKSKGNYVGVTDAPAEMFGKLMSIPDELMGNYARLLTSLEAARIDELTDPSRTHPRQAKASLAGMIVEQYHDADAARAAGEEFDRVFAEHKAPSEMPEIALPAGSMNVVDLVVQAGFAKSKGEAKRLVGQSAVSIDDEKINDIHAQITPQTGQVLKVGKRRFGRLVVD